MASVAGGRRTVSKGKKMCFFQKQSGWTDTEYFKSKTRVRYFPRDLPCDRDPGDPGNQPSRSRLISLRAGQTRSQFCEVLSLRGRSNGNPGTTTGGFANTTRLLTSTHRTRRSILVRSARRHRPQRQDHSAINGHFTRWDAGSLRFRLGRFDCACASPPVG